MGVNTTLGSPKSFPLSHQTVLEFVVFTVTCNFDYWQMTGRQEGAELFCVRLSAFVMHSYERLSVFVCCCLDLRWTSKMKHFGSGAGHFGRATTSEGHKVLLTYSICIKQLDLVKEKQDSGKVFIEWYVAFCSCMTQSIYLQNIYWKKLLGYILKPLLRFYPEIGQMHRHIVCL